MKLHSIVAPVILFFSATTFAGPADYVYTPAVEYGEREIDFKFGSQRLGDGNPDLSAWSVGIGYGATEWWFTEIYAKYKFKTPGNSSHYDAWEWENKFQLTETGKYPVDLGFLLELEHPKDRSEGWEIKWGPLLQTEFGKWQLNGNLLLKRNYRVDSPSDTELAYQAQVKYRGNQQLEFGVQAFGAVGKWSNWQPSNQQSHQAGPAIFGKLPLGNHQAIKYNAAWLIGVSQGASDQAFRLQTEYEF